MFLHMCFLLTDDIFCLFNLLHYYIIFVYFALFQKHDCNNISRGQTSFNSSQLRRQGKSNIKSEAYYWYLDMEIGQKVEKNNKFYIKICKKIRIIDSKDIHFINRYD